MAGVRGIVGRTDLSVCLCKVLFIMLSDTSNNRSQPVAQALWWTASCSTASEMFGPISQLDMKGGALQGVRGHCGCSPLMNEKEKHMLHVN